MTQLSLDDLSRGTGQRGPCRWIVRTSASGRVLDDMVVLGRCGLMGDIAHDRRCTECTQWEGRE